VNAVFRRLRQSLARDPGLPLSAKVSRIFGFAVATLSARSRLRGCETGRRARTMGHVSVRGSGIRIGDDFVADARLGVIELDATAPLSIGDRVFVNFGVRVSAAAEVRLGSRVDLGPYCTLVARNAPIDVGDDVWLGARVTVREGARIGAGTVVAAGSVVEGELPPGALAAGRPARVVRFTGGRGESRTKARPEMPEAPAPARAPFELHVCEPLGNEGRSLRALGSSSRVSGAPHLRCFGTLEVGQRFTLRSQELSHLVVAPGAAVRIGDDVVVGDGAAISAHAGVTIGARTRLGKGVFLIDFDFHGITERERPEPAQPIRIGADVRIGDRAIVLRGVTVGDGACIGDDSVVARDVPAGASVCGAPARPVSPLPPPPTRA
jgi:acetyltransferase-like isoleucine patch superfamily enzyme